MSDPIRIGVVTVSDRASSGEYEDRGGPALLACLREFLTTPFEPEARVIPDEAAGIEATLRELIDERRCCLVVTTGGTGPSRRDVTVEATRAVVDKILPGFGEHMRRTSLEKVPTAILSRQEAGVRYRPGGPEAGGALIVNLPGSPKAIRECLLAVFPAVPGCVELLGGPSLETNQELLPAFHHHKKHS